MQRDMKAELRAWQLAKEERLAKERARKAAKPEFRLGGRCPRSAAGTLLWAARAVPKKNVPSTRTKDCSAPRGYGYDAPRDDLPPSTDHMDFLEMCLGGPEALLEQEIEKDKRNDPLSRYESSSENASSLTTANVAHFTIHSERSSLDGRSKSLSSDGDELSSLGLDDMFAFDPEKLAAVFNKNASKADLTQFLRASYADALEQRLLSSEAGDVVDCKDCQSESSSPRPHAESISQLMTPLQITPICSPRQFASPDMAGGCSKACTEQALADALDRKQRHSRRSSAIRRRSSAVQREVEEVRAVECYGRRSLAGAQDLSNEDQEFIKGAIESAAKTVVRRHRRSLDRAVEVLECAADAASESLDQWAEQEVEEKVDLIHQAMDEACSLHRKSIIEAVRQVTMSGEGAQGVDMKVQDNGVLSTVEPYCNSADVAAGGCEVDARIRRLVSEAYARQIHNSADDAPQENTCWVSVD